MTDLPVNSAESSARKREGSVRRYSEVSEALAISNFPQSIQGLLGEAFDENGDGHIGTAELVAAANEHINTKTKNTLLRKGLCVAVVLAVLMIAFNAGLTAGIIKANKDTHVEGRNLMANGEKGPVSVGTNEVTLTLAAIPFIPAESASHINDLSFTSEDEETVYHRRTRTIDVKKDSAVTITTTAGDTISWTADGGTDLDITLADGTAWSLCMFCTDCTAANVYATPEVLEGLEMFDGFTGTPEGESSQRHRRLPRIPKSCNEQCEQPEEL